MSRPKGLIQICPQCGSGDVRWENISKRPYCNDCGHWGKVNHDQTIEAGVQSWNEEVRKAGKEYLAWLR